MRASDDCFKIIEHFEGYRDTAYRDGKGVVTIGYGHTGDVAMGDTCTNEQAVEWLKQDITTAEHDINTMVHAPLNQNQFDALVSFVFNIGAGNFRDSTLLKFLNLGNYTAAAHEFARWVFVAGKTSNGQKERRLKEQLLFEKGV